MQLALFELPIEQRKTVIFFVYSPIREFYLKPTLFENYFIGTQICDGENYEEYYWLIKKDNEVIKRVYSINN